MKFIADDIIEKLKAFRHSGVKGGDSSSHGQRFSERNAGMSTEFSEYSRYVPGDNTKHMDWKVYAKTGRLYVKRFLDERAKKCYFIIDSSASMAYKGKKAVYSKWEYAARMMMARAALSLLRRDSCSFFSISGNDILSVPFSSSLSSLSRFDDFLSAVKISGRTFPGGKTAAFADSAEANSMVFVFSDLIMEDGEIERFTGLLLAKKMKVNVFHVLDDEESALPALSAAVLKDPETGSSMDVSPSAMEKFYRGEFARWMKFLSELFAAKGAAFLSARTSMPFDKVLDEYLSVAES